MKQTTQTGGGKSQRQIRLTDGAETWVLRVGTVGHQRGLIIAREHAGQEHVTHFITEADVWTRGGPRSLK